MRFLVMHKVDAKMEAGEPPSPEVIERMGELIGESMKSGICVDGAGLHRSAKRVRVRSRGGRSMKLEGPYAGENELVASLAMVKARSIGEAAGLAERLAEAAGCVEVEVGPVVEAWDLGIMPKPKSEYERFLLLVKGGARTESGESPNPNERAATQALLSVLGEQRVLLMRMALAPTSKAKRLASGPEGRRRWMDGPFAESKELIAGFAVLEVPSVREAIEWAGRYVAILGENEVDIRVLVD